LVVLFGINNYNLNMERQFLPQTKRFVGFLVEKIIKYIILWTPVLGGILYLLKLLDDFFEPVDQKKVFWQIWKVYQSVVISGGVLVSYINLCF